MIKVALIDQSFFLCESFKIVDINIVAELTSGETYRELACMLDHVAIATEDEIFADQLERAKVKPNRVELAPHTDAWMQGDRFGAIHARRANGEILVLLDKSRRKVWFKKDDITREFRSV